MPAGELSKRIVSKSSEDHVSENRRNATDPVAQALQRVSAFKPENLLREARRQKNLPEISVPEICILDPDGDIVRYLCNAGKRAVTLEPTVFQIWAVLRRNHSGAPPSRCHPSTFDDEGHRWGFRGEAPLSCL